MNLAPGPSIRPVSTRAWISFAAVSTLWGMPYLFIKIAVDDGVSPIFLAWVRIVLGAAVLLALAWRAGVLGALRGRWHSFQGIKVMPTYHPAYLLRTPSAKRTVWEDLQLVMAELGKPLP